ncbi:MAG TPA: molybdopterin-dependent oxidoreductase [Solirubrobacterales bacterium]|nr:molybdopterin-dependent oxidoreductase [Solirubrobacterales bacterium]
MTTVRETYCRNCEALCGLRASVEDGRVTELRPSPGHPVSRGYACAKGLAMARVQGSPSRLTQPLRRLPGGGFERVSWERAVAEIGERLSAAMRAHGPEAVGLYLGNPAAFSHTHTLAARGFMAALGSRQAYSAISQDGGSRFAASALLYGTATAIPVADVDRTEFLLAIGANPFVSNGSLMVAPDVRRRLREIVARGGRVVVVDPRRSETASAFEHLPIRPGTDAWLLLAMLNVLFAEGLVDREAVAVQAAGIDELAAAASRVTPELAAERTGIAATEIEALARSFAAAPSAVAYGRTGTCTSAAGTVVAALMDALNVLSGNFDRPGGALFGWTPWPFAQLAGLTGLDGYARHRSRIGDLPEVMGFLPAALMSHEVGETVRALVVSAGNPVLSVPGGERLRQRLGELDLLVSIDLFQNESNEQADFILPAATWLERADTQLVFLPFMLEPAVQWTDPITAPAGAAREERLILAALLASVRGGPPWRRASRRAVSRLLRADVARLTDVALRASAIGDWFGLRRRGLSIRRLREEPRGVVVRSAPPAGRRRRVVRNRGRRIQLAPAPIMREIAALRAEPAPAGFPLLLIGRRQRLSLNSWMHEGPVARRSARLLVSPPDAEAAALADGDRVRVESESGAVEAAVEVSDEVGPGLVSLPHGWGPLSGSANVNDLTPVDPGRLERLAGMARLNAVPVRIEKAGEAREVGSEP